jgi:hypothetical protein
MKKLLLILLCLPFIGFAQSTYVPDDNFEQALINLGYDNVLDDYVLTAYINTVTSLLVAGQNITDLTGIEDFISLTTLNCYSNQLTTLDVSSNIALTTLYCRTNQLTSLDVSSNTALTYLDCNYNQLTTLDVSTNTALTYLECSSNQLTTLGVSGTTALTTLWCSENQLTTLDVSNNTALTKLWCSENQLTTLDVSSNTALDELICRYNQLITLDVSSNITLDTLICGHQQQLTTLDLRNGNNTNLQIVSANNCPNLYCINVDDVAWATANWTVANGNIDSWANFSNNCAAVVFGCTDSLACNYDAAANTDDGSCNYNSSSYDTLSVTASIVWNGNTLSVSGDYSDTLINSAGCDSITNLNLTITQPNSFISGNDTICYNQNIDAEVSVYFSNGITPFTFIYAINGVNQPSITTNVNPYIISTQQQGIYTLTSFTDANAVGTINGSAMVFVNNSPIDCPPPSAIQEQTTNKKLLKVTDILGRKTKEKTNQPLFYIYDDGTVEKRIVIE